MSKITDIFYNEIIKEASTGRVESFFYYNILFETYFKEDNTKISSDVKDMLIPILTIHNRNHFNNLLEEYVNLALSFYDERNYEDEVNNDINLKIKTIITLLFSNATYEDFVEAENFLRKRISFLKSNCEFNNVMGFSNILNGDISLNIAKDKIYNETPYKMSFIANNENGEYHFPEIKFGLNDNEVHIYAIQRNITDDNDYAKRVNRALYKVGEGYDNDPRIKDITPSFLVALDMAVSYFKSLGYTHIVAPSILLPRYNAKKMKIEMLKAKKTEAEILALEQMQEHIQNNLTDKFLRTFLRLEHHFPDSLIIVSSYILIDSNLHIQVKEELIGNNSLLNEVAQITNLSSYTR